MGGGGGIRGRPRTFQFSAHPRKRRAQCFALGCCYLGERRGWRGVAAILRIRHFTLAALTGNMTLVNYDNRVLLSDETALG